MSGKGFIRTGDAVQISGGRSFVCIKGLHLDLLIWVLSFEMNYDFFMSLHKTINPSTINRDDSGPDLLCHTVCLWWQWTLASYELLYNTMCSSGDVAFLMPLGTPQCLPLLWRLSSCLGKWVKFSPYKRVLTYHHNMFQSPSYLLPAVSVHTTTSAKVNEPSPSPVTDP